MADQHDDQRPSLRPWPSAGVWRVLRVARASRLTGRGFAALASAASVTMLGLIFLAAVSQDVIFGDGLETHDATNLQLVIDHRSPLLISLAHGLTELGSVVVVAAVAMTAGAALWWRGRRAVVALAPVASLLLAGGLAGLGKVLVARSRPPVGVRLIPEADASFPSGHSADGAAVYIALGLVLAVVVFRRPLARIASVASGAALAAGIGASRLELGVHWPTDVLAGLALGTCAAIVVTTAALLADHVVSSRPPGGDTARARTLERAVRVLGSRRSLTHLTA